MSNLMISKYIFAIFENVGKRLDKWHIRLNMNVIASRSLQKLFYQYRLSEALYHPIYIYMYIYIYISYSRPFYLYNGNPYALKDSLYIGTSPRLFGLFVTEHRWVDLCPARSILETHCNPAQEAHWGPCDQGHRTTLAHCNCNWLGVLIALCFMMMKYHKSPYHITGTLVRWNY